MITLLTEAGLSKEQKKVQSAYERMMGQAIAVMKGDKNFKELTKIPEDQVEDVLNELIEEQVKDKKEEFKTRMKSLFKKRVEFERLVDQKKKEFNSEIAKKMKEFTQEGAATMNLLSDIDGIVKAYKQSFSQEHQAANTALNNEDEETDKREEE